MTRNTVVEGALASRILRYWLMHPDATDTLDGIGWWLPGKRSGWSRDELKDAVGLLVLRGWVREIAASSSPTLYAFKPERAREANDSLAKGELG